MKKKLLAELFPFLNIYYLKIQLIKVLISLDSSRLYGRTLENSKTGGFRDFFGDFGGLEINRGHEIQTFFHMLFYI